MESLTTKNGQGGARRSLRAMGTSVRQKSNILKYRKIFGRSAFEIFFFLFTSEFSAFESN